jgi:hypothetical protein
MAYLKDIATLMQRYLDDATVPDGESVDIRGVGATLLLLRAIP